MAVAHHTTVHPLEAPDCNGWHHVLKYLRCTCTFVSTVEGQGAAAKQTTSRLEAAYIRIRCLSDTGLSIQ